MARLVLIGPGGTPTAVTKMNDTRRMFLILAILAKGGRLTVKQVRAKLPVRFRTHVRSVQRDLRQLSKWAPLHVDKTEKPYRWKVQRGADCPCCGRRLGAK